MLQYRNSLPTKFRKFGFQMIEEALLSFSFAIIQIDCDSFKLDKH